MNIKTIPNNYHTKSIGMDYEVRPYCPIGKAEYEADLDIDIEPNKVVPEYISLTEELKKLNGQSLTVEELAWKVKSGLAEALDCPVQVSVMAFSNKHLVVDVEAE